MNSLKLSSLRTRSFEHKISYPFKPEFEQLKLKCRISKNTIYFYKNLYYDYKRLKLNYPVFFSLRGGKSKLLLFLFYYFCSTIL